VGESAVWNITRDRCLARRAVEATGFWDRGKGLLGTAALAEGAGLWIEPCNSVHTWFMRYPIDVVFTAADGRVVAVRERLAPWRLTWPAWGARAALELPAGAAADTRPGDELRRSACA
jgi:uncharacterized membrane protein (UPF0127 family)